MGTFAETASVYCRLSFTDQGKINFRFPFAANKQKFANSVLSLQNAENQRKLPFSISSISVC
jgi:hypothetical protein